MNYATHGLRCEARSVVLQPQTREEGETVRESDLQKLILDWLAVHRIFHYRNNTGAMFGQHKGKRWGVRFGKKGAPDIVAVVKGQYVGIECKGARGCLSNEQAQFGTDLEKAGGRYLVIWELQELIEALTATIEVLECPQ